MAVKAKIYLDFLPLCGKGVLYQTHVNIGQTYFLNLRNRRLSRVTTIVPCPTFGSTRLIILAKRSTPAIRFCHVLRMVCVSLAKPCSCLSACCSRRACSASNCSKVRSRLRSVMIHLLPCRVVGEQDSTQCPHQRVDKPLLAEHDRQH